MTQTSPLPNPLPKGEGETVWTTLKTGRYLGVRGFPSGSLRGFAFCKSKSTHKALV